MIHLGSIEAIQLSSAGHGYRIPLHATHCWKTWIFHLVDVVCTHFDDDCWQPTTQVHFSCKSRQFSYDIAMYKHLIHAESLFVIPLSSIVQYQTSIWLALILSQNFYETHVHLLVKGTIQAHLFVKCRIPLISVYYAAPCLIRIWQCVTQCSCTLSS